jgi:type II secretion system protein N
MRFELTRRQQRILRRAGYPLLALITFVTAVFYSFPYERLKDKLIAALSSKYEVSIADARPTLIPGGMVLERVSLTPRPDPGDDEEPGEEKPVPLVFDRVELDVGLLALLTGRVHMDVEAEVGGGSIDGTIKYSKAGIDVELETEELPLGNLPGIKGAIGLPMAGGLNAEVQLKLTRMKWAEADGYMTMSCPRCTIGDGRSKIKPRMTKQAKLRRTSVFAAEGITVPRLDLGDLTAEVEIKKGVGKIKKFAGKSPDGEVKMEGELRFADPFRRTMFPVCLKFKLSEALKKREPRFGNIDMLMPVAKQTDGFAAMRNSHELVRMRFKAAPDGCQGGATGTASGSAFGSGRPSFPAPSIPAPTNEGFRAMPPPAALPPPASDVPAPGAGGEGPPMDSIDPNDAPRIPPPRTDPDDVAPATGAPGSDESGRLRDKEDYRPPGSEGGNYEPPPPPPSDLPAPMEPPPPDPGYGTPVD